MPTNLELTLTLDSNQGFESRPGFDVLKLLTNAHDTLLSASVSLVSFSVAVFCHKVSFNVFEQLTLITFERAQIVIATIDYQLTRFFVC